MTTEEYVRPTWEAVRAQTIQTADTYELQGKLNHATSCATDLSLGVDDCMAWQRDADAYAAELARRWNAGNDGYD